MRTVLSLFALLVSFVLALPAAAQQACSDFELVGFTSTTHLGDTGVLGFTQACGAEFTRSRMCTSVEVMQTVDVPGGLSGEAWVRPVFVSSSGPGATSTTPARPAADASGRRAFNGTSSATSDYLSCDGWSTPFRIGLAVGFEGAFASFDCNTPLAVACCAAPPSPALAAILPLTSPAGRMMLVIMMLGAVGIYATRRTAPAR